MGIRKYLIFFVNLGKFITIEGGDGAGKSTQSGYLYTNLKKKGINVTKTREPGGCPESESIRELLVTGDPNKWSPLTETLLHCASRSSHLKTTIIYDGFQGKSTIDQHKMVHQALKNEIGKEIHAITISTSCT